MFTFSNYIKQMKFRSSVHMSSPPGHGGIPPHVSEEEEEAPPVGVEEEESPPTSPPSRPIQRREEERCGSGWSFPPPAYEREEEF
jgi:hypothetical protein